MNIQQDISLKNLTTMQLGGVARQVVEVKTRADVAEAVRYAREHNLQWYVLGGGSNTLAHDEGFDGLVILNRISGFEIVDDVDEAADVVNIVVGAGETWDDFVRRAVEMGLSGVECLSAIPGTVGAAPVQNIGAYGQEVASTIVSVNAYDARDNEFTTIDNIECEFAYRHSIFRGRWAGRYIITSVKFKLSRRELQPPFYAAIQRYLDEHDIGEHSPQTLRDVVMKIRFDKLPDPQKRPNTGSFFKNAIIPAGKLDELQRVYPDMPHYNMPHDMYKIPTGWLIDKCGLKGSLHHGMRVHDKNALVLINESARSYNDLAQARQEIITAVNQKFGIVIEQEPLEISNKSFEKA